MKRLLRMTGVAFLPGPSMTGKTFLAVEIGLRVSRGEPLGGLLSKACGVIYLAVEDPQGVRERITAWKLENGGHGAFELIGTGLNLLNQGDYEALRRTLSVAAAEMDAENTPLGLLIVDTWSKATPGADQNSSGEMGAAQVRLDALARELGVLVLAVAHTGKNEERGIAGWYGQFAGADAVLMLTKDTEIHGVRTLTVAKLKNGRAGTKLAFRLRALELGRDEDGDAVTSCVVDFDAGGQSERVPGTPKRKAKVPPEAHIVLQAIGYVTDNGPTKPAPLLPGVAPMQQAVARADVLARAIQSGFATPDEARNTINTRFRRAMLVLDREGRVRQEGDLLWLLSDRGQGGPLL